MEERKSWWEARTKSVAHRCCARGGGVRKAWHEGRPVIVPFIESGPFQVTGRAPRERWDCDILEGDGEKRFKTIAEEIKQACAALRDVSRK